MDHGSRRAASNAQLAAVARMVEAAAPSILVRHAHMELASPSLAEAVAECVACGATEVVVFPYFLASGRHVTEDIPRLAAEAAASHPGTPVRVAEPFGLHPAIAGIVLERCGQLPEP